MAEVQISRVKIHHEQILTWLILNPDKTQGECAAHFGVTETWLSIIINSDVFQSRWRERRDFMAEHADKNIMGLMREAATKGLGKLIDKIDTSADPEFLLAATDKILNRMGYGPKAGGATVTVTNTAIQITAADLQAGRAVIESTGQAFLEAKDVTPERLTNQLDCDNVSITPFPTSQTSLLDSFDIPVLKP